MIRKVLVPVDYSEASRNALETAVVIAERNRASLTLLYITDASGGAEDPYIFKNAKQICHVMAESIAQKHAITTNVLFAEGYVGAVIVKTAVEQKTDLIIMGAHGASGHRDLFIGSNSSYVIKFATCPVLIVPEGKRWRDFNRVLWPIRPTFGALKMNHYVTDVVQNPGGNSLEIFGISVEKRDADVKRVTDMANEMHEKLNRQTIKLSLGFSYVRNVAEEVLERADQSKADLIVITPTIDIANKQFFIGPFTQRIINHARMPVLSVLRVHD
jgi:nucleotide-binding universal stress UspA family protein